MNYTKTAMKSKVLDYVNSKKYAHDTAKDAEFSVIAKFLDWLEKQ